MRDRPTPVASPYAANCAVCDVDSLAITDAIANACVVWPDGNDASPLNAWNVYAGVPSRGRDRPTAVFSTGVVIPAAIRLLASPSAAMVRAFGLSNAAPTTANAPITGK